MTTLTLAKLAEIEVAAASYTKDPVGFLETIDPATVAALVRIARAAELSRRSGFRDNMALYNAIRDAGLLE